MTCFDLHMHSCYSPDGELTPQDLIQKAKQAQLKVVALSDHNCMKGIDEMIEAGNKENILVIPAIEFDTRIEEEDLDVHLLGYQFDYHQPYFEQLDDHIRSLQEQVLGKRIAHFKSYYQVEFNETEILKDIGTSNPFNAIVEAMLNDPKNRHIEAFQPYLPGGARAIPQLPNFFWDTCSKGTPGYFPIPAPSLQETIARIHDGGGLAIIAHPWKTFYKRDDLLKQALDWGIDGLEAYSNYHEEKHTRYYENFCKQHHLLITCGSDFHGKVKPHIQLGEYGYKHDDNEILLTHFLKALQKKGKTTALF